MNKHLVNEWGLKDLIRSFNESREIKGKTLMKKGKWNNWEKC